MNVYQSTTTLLCWSWLKRKGEDKCHGRPLELLWQTIKHKSTPGWMHIERFWCIWVRFCLSSSSKTFCLCCYRANSHTYHFPSNFHANGSLVYETYFQPNTKHSSKKTYKFSSFLATKSVSRNKSVETRKFRFAKSVENNGTLFEFPTKITVNINHLLWQSPPELEFPRPHFLDSPERTTSWTGSSTGAGGPGGSGTRRASLVSAMPPTAFCRGKGCAV